MTCHDPGRPERMRVSCDRRVGLDVAAGGTILTVGLGFDARTCTVGDGLARKGAAACCSRLHVLPAPCRSRTPGGMSRACSRSGSLREYGLPLDREPPSPKPLLDARTSTATAGD
jgi:hypothetical protein